MTKNPASGFKLEGKVTYGNPFNIFLLNSSSLIVLVISFFIFSLYLSSTLLMPSTKATIRLYLYLYIYKKYLEKEEQAFVAIYLLAQIYKYF